MALPARKRTAADRQARTVTSGWQGRGRITTAADVARVLAEVRTVGAERTNTAVLSRVVQLADEVAVDTADIARTLAVVPELASLLPWAGIRRGATIAASGSTSLLLALLGGAQRAGATCTVVGTTRLVLAAPEYAIDLSRLALIPEPGAAWPEIVAALIDGLDMIVIETAGPVAPRLASRLMARARHTGAVLIPTSPDWPGADLYLEQVSHTWEGLGAGRGRLRTHHATIRARGRGAASRPRETTLQLPPPSLRTARSTDQVQASPEERTQTTPQRVAG
jgi:hypothetical protein